MTRKKRIFRIRLNFYKSYFNILCCMEQDCTEPGYMEPDYKQCRVHKLSDKPPGLVHKEQESDLLRSYLLLLKKKVRIKIKLSFS